MKSHIFGADDREEMQAWVDGSSRDINLPALSTRRFCSNADRAIHGEDLQFPSSLSGNARKSVSGAES